MSNSYQLLLEKSRFHTTLSPTLKETVKHFLMSNRGLFRPRNEDQVNRDQIQLLRRVAHRVWLIKDPLFVAVAPKDRMPRGSNTYKHGIQVGTGRASVVKNAAFLAKLEKIIESEKESVGGRGEILLDRVHHWFGYWLYEVFKTKVRSERGREPGRNYVKYLTQNSLKDAYGLFGMDENDFYESLLKGQASNFKNNFVRISNIGYEKEGTDPLEDAANWITIIKRLKKHVEACSPNPGYHRWVLRAIKGHDSHIASIEDAGSVRDLLSEYDELKRRRKITGREADIMFFNGNPDPRSTFYQLANFVEEKTKELPLVADPEKEELMKSQSEIRDHGSYLEIHPLTKAASCYFGRGTRWCTAATNNNRYSVYKDSAKEFFILQSKSGGRSGRVQVYIPSNSANRAQIMDIQDRPIRDLEDLVKRFPIMAEKLKGVKNIYGHA